MNLKKAVLFNFIFLTIPWLNLNLFSQENSLRFDHITVENGLSQNTIRCITKDKFGFMWFGTWEGACRYDGYNFKIFRANENDTNALSNNRINYFFKDSNENIWMATGDMILCRYNYETENFSRYTTDKVPGYIAWGLSRHNNYNRSHAGNKKYTWWLNYSELLQSNNQTKQEVKFTKDPFDPTSLNDHNLINLYLDNTDILWIGSENNGINKADTRAKPFATYIHSPVSDNSLIDNVVRAVCEDKEHNIWVGTYNSGLTMIDVKSLKFTRFQNSPDGLVSNQIRSLYCDRSGCIWIGTKSGLNMYHPKTKRFKRYTTTTRNPIPNNWIFWITEDHCGYLWIGTFNGIAKYNRNIDVFLSFKPDSLLKSKNVRVILEDRKFNFWVATEGGGITLVRRDSTSGFAEKLTPLKHFTYSQTDTNSLINNMVLTMAEDEDGMIWIGTNNGLCRLNPGKNIIKRINITSGFPDNLIMGIVCDLNGHIWISHKRGITRLNIKDLKTRTYTKSDGLQGNEFTQNAYFRSKSSGKLFFGGSNGMNVFYPDSIKDNPYYPQIVFTGLKILNQPVQINQSVNDHVILKESIVTTKEITLHYEDKSIAIEFAALHYSNPSGNKYKYMLEGFDNNWVETDGTNRVANYSNLLAGKYIFKVQAANSDGLWNPETAELKIVVLPPWWKSWWAYIIYAFILLVIIYFSYKYVVNRIQFKNQLAFERLKAEQMHELDQMKLEFFTNISHELRTPLSLIIDPLEKLKNNEVEQPKVPGYYSLMHRNARRLLRLINQLLDFRKSESGQLKLELSYSDIIAFIKDATDMFSYQASQRNISLQFQSFADSFLTYFDPDKLDKVIFNLLSNAFKYTRDGGSVFVAITSDTQETSGINSGNIIIEVRDTGIGISEEYTDKIFDVFYQVEGNKAIQGEGTGIGLALTKKLVELHHGKIIVESYVGKGSSFKIILPLDFLATYYQNNKHLSDGYKVFKKEEYDDIRNVAGSGETKKDNDSPLPYLLIVEDNIEVRAYIADEFKAAYNIMESANGIDGYNKAKETIPDLIISDVMMPGMDGMELCKKLKTDEHTSHIPLILLTARQSEKFKLEGYETGADAYITKPFSTAILKAQVKNLIESRQRLRELFSKGNTFDTKAISVNITDETFLNKAIEIIKENINENNFDTEILATRLKMSQRQLYRKIKALTDQTVHDFIISVKLNIAAELLLSGDLSISEVAYKVGYSEPANFTRTFTKKFGKNPSGFIQEFKK